MHLPESILALGLRMLAVICCSSLPLLRRKTEALLRPEGENGKNNARSDVGIFAGNSSAARDNCGKSCLQEIGKNAPLLALHRRDDAGRQQNQIGEYSLGVEVYNRTDEFDPRLNSIVRVDAARLRSKLREYYETEGRDDVIHIEIPKGTYIPVVSNEKAAPSFDHEREAFVRGTGKAIAVMPFLDLSPHRDQWQFGRGLAEELSFSLSRIPQLSVVSSISVLALKRRRLDVPRIGRRLGLDGIIEGSIRMSSGKFRIAVRLTDASTGYQLWSEAYERRVGDVLSLQKKIASLVSKAVRTKLNVGKDSRQLSLQEATIVG